MHILHYLKLKAGKKPQTCSSSEKKKKKPLFLTVLLVFDILQFHHNVCRYGIPYFNPAQE